MAKKPDAKVVKPEVTLEQLIAVAEDFNAFMFTDGEKGINLELDQDDLLKEITELCIDLVDTDVVSAGTAATLALLGIACPAEVVAEAGEDVEDDADDDNDTGEVAAKAADLALVKKSTKIDKIKEIAKLYKISIPPPFLKDLAKLKRYVIGKLDGFVPAKAKAEKVKKTNDGSSLKGPGIIKTIVATLKEKGPITKEGILAILVEKFPDRNAEAMKKTINVQIPNRVSKEHDLVIEKTDKGYKVSKTKK